MKKNNITLRAKYFGYIRESQASFCQDKCARYHLEDEYGKYLFNIYSENQNYSYYVDRYVKVVTKSEINCIECSAMELSEIEISDQCINPVDCFADPCSVETCNIDESECIANYCGGCYADFYKNGNIMICDNCCNLTNIDFGLCTMVLGIGLVKGKCQYVSGCSSIVNGVDYSHCLYENIDKCNSNCISNINFLIDFILEITEPTEEQFSLFNLYDDNVLNILDVIKFNNIQ